MPVYEYGCAAGHRFEVKQKIHDAPVSTCQVCDLPVSKLISPPAISFKGSGWYVTDYSDKLKPPATEVKTGKPAETPPKPSEPKTDGAEIPAAVTPPAAARPSSAGGSASGSGSPASAPSGS